MNIKIFKALCSLIIITGTITAQSTQFDWVKTYGGSGFQQSFDLTIDSEGNLLSVGTYQGTADMDPGTATFNLTAPSSTNTFIQKLDSNGAFIWAKSINVSSFSQGTAIAADNKGNVYVTGYFNGNVDFDPGSAIVPKTGKGSIDIFLLKLDKNGNFVWVKTMGSTGSDQGNDVAIDAFGNVYLTGNFTGTVDFAPDSNVIKSTYKSVGNTDIFIVKYDELGRFNWASALGGFSRNESNAITIDNNGNVITCGHFGGTVDFDPSNQTMNITAAGSTDLFIHKTNSSGQLIWVKTTGSSSGIVNGYDITTDAKGNMYCTGRFNNTVDLRPGTGTSVHTSNGNYDAFILKLKSNGDFGWSKAFGGSQNEDALSVKADEKGFLYLCGQFGRTVDFNPNSGTFNVTSSANSTDAYIEVLDSTGAFIEVLTMGGPTSLDDCMSVELSANGKLYSTGYFTNVADLDPTNTTNNITPTGTRDVFVQKFGACITKNSTDTQTKCDSYTWMDGNTYTSSNNSSRHTLKTVTGCDSVITLDLTINKSTSSTDVQSACNSFKWMDGNTYSANNSTAQFTVVNSVGCDSIVTLNLTINTVNDTIELSNKTLTAKVTGANYQWLDCDNAYSRVSGETNLTFTPKTSGSFACAITQFGCTDTSACIEVTIPVVGSINSINSEDHALFPNPTKGIVTLNTSSHETLTLHIFNAQGKLVQEIVNSADTELTFNIEGPSGVYLAVVRGTDNTTRFLLIKE